MDILMIVLRLIHVLSGVFWAGSTFLFAAHVTPAVKLAGADGQKFMQQLTRGGKLSNALGATGIAAVVTGWTMVILKDWYLAFNTASGIVLAFGGILGTLGFIHGATVQRKAIVSLSTLGGQIAASGGPPTPEQAAEMDRLAGKVETNGRILAYILALTVAAMGTFQYFG